MLRLIRDVVLVLGVLVCFLALMYFLDPNRHGQKEEGVCTDSRGRSWPCLAEP